MHFDLVLTWMLTAKEPELITHGDAGPVEAKATVARGRREQQIPANPLGIR